MIVPLRGKTPVSRILGQNNCEFDNLHNFGAKNHMGRIGTEHTQKGRKEYNTKTI